MKKITSYILNGQGLGMKFLAGLSVLMALIFAIVIRVQGAAYVPYAQEIADQMLPVKVVNGQIVEPLNTFKMAQIRIEGRDTPLALPLVLDTRVTNLDANLLPQGVYVTRTNIYTVNRNQVKVIKIEGDNYIPKGDYTDVFKSWLNWSAVIGGIAGIVILFVLYLILTMFYALCTQVIAKLARRDMAFDSRMRLSAVVLTAAYILFIPLGWLGVSSTLLFLAVMLGALIWFVVKYVPTGKTAAAKKEPRRQETGGEDSQSQTCRQRKQISKSPLKREGFVFLSSSGLFFLTVMFGLDPNISFRLPDQVRLSIFVMLGFNPGIYFLDIRVTRSA